MASTMSAVIERQIPSMRSRVNAVGWLITLVVSVIFLVYILLRQSTETFENDKVRWSIERADSWYISQPWFLGANYLPSTSVNVLEMWQSTFDEETIGRELSWANRRLRMNSLRVFLHILVWMEERELFYQRLEIFLRLAQNNQLKVMLVLFDECGKPDPRLGRQPEPTPGVHNSQWVRCPGQSMVSNRTSWPIIRQFTIDVIKRYKADQRIFAWDLYNEPECSKQVKIILPLMRYIYEAARSVGNVQQPMTIGISKWPITTSIVSFALAVSDIISFHSYGSLANMMQNVTDLRRAQPGRPILCTEWLARSYGSTVFTHLEYFASENIAAVQRGLVAGRSQTYYPWRSVEGASLPKVWFHDVLFPNGTAFSRCEQKFYFQLKH